MSNDVLLPPVGWSRSRSKPQAQPPEGYKLHAWGAAAAKLAASVWGVQPIWGSQCTYGLWIREGATPPTTAEESPLVRDAAAWLDAGGVAAVHCCQKQYPYGRARILAYCEEMGCPVPDRYCLRMADLATFLDTADNLYRSIVCTD
jgi:hypothetical protein